MMERYDKGQEQVKWQGKGQMEDGDKRKGEWLWWNERC